MLRGGRTSASLTTTQVETRESNIEPLLILHHSTARQKTDGVWVGQNLYLHGSSNLKDQETVNVDCNAPALLSQT